MVGYIYVVWDWNKQYWYADLNREKFENIFIKKEVNYLFHQLSSGKRELPICQRCDWYRLMPDEIYKIAKSSYKENGIEESLKWFDRVLKIKSSPKHLKINSCLFIGDVYKVKNQESKSTEMYKHGLTLLQEKTNKEKIDIYKQGVFLERLEELDKALNCFRQISEDIETDRIGDGANYHIGEIIKAQKKGGSIVGKIAVSHELDVI